MSRKKRPDFSDVLRAAERISGHAHRTPVFTSSLINERLDAEIFFKAENMQVSGAFKFRGAVNTILSLSDAERNAGVCTHSSGNHAGALARAASSLGIPCHVVMPENAPPVKRRAVVSYGAAVTTVPATLEAREAGLEQVQKRTGATFIHPYDDHRIIAGQGTAAYELITDCGPLDVVVTPVGGGGLLSGTAISTRAVLPRAQIIAAEPQGADDALRSLRGGVLEPSVSPETVCDGLLTSLSPLTFSIIQKSVSDIIPVSDTETIAAMRMIWEYMKLVVETNSATVLAALLREPRRYRKTRIGVILSGGNVDLDTLPW